MLAWSFVKRSDRRGFRSAAALGAALALVALAALSGCGGTPGSRVGVNEVTARAGADGVQAVEIEVHSFYFKPNRIIVEAGKPVDLTLKFKSLFAPHNMTCEHPDAGISIDKSKGIISFNRTKHVRFTPAKPGEYEFFCGVGSHMAKGMTGSIVVR
jgi:plastocyanin